MVPSGLFTRGVEILGRGQVMEDLVAGDIFLKVIPKFIPHLFEASKDGPKEEKYKFKTMDGTEKEIITLNTNYVIARYLSLNDGNRFSPPNVVKGETVLLIQFIGEPELYWMDMDNEQDIRNREEAIWTYSNKPDEYPDGQIPDQLQDNYMFIISTIAKFLGFRTSRTDGEKAAYKVEFRTGSGEVEVSDDYGNMFILYSENGVLKMRLAGALLKRVDKDNVEVIGGTDNFIVQGKTIKRFYGPKLLVNEEIVNEVFRKKVSLSFMDGLDMNVKTQLQLKAKEGMILHSGKDIGITSVEGEIIVFSGKKVQVVSPEVSITAPVVSVTGCLQAASISVGGGGSGSPQPLLAEIEDIDESELEEWQKNIKKIVALPSEEQEEEKEEEEKEEEKKEEEKKPEEVDGKSQQEDSNIEAKGKVIVNGQKGVECTGQTFKITGQSGTSISGGGVALDEILSEIIDALSGLAVNGLTVNTPAGGGSGSAWVELETCLKKLEATKTKITTFKG